MIAGETNLKSSMFKYLTQAQLDLADHTSGCQPGCGLVLVTSTLHGNSMICQKSCVILKQLDGLLGQLNLFCVCCIFPRPSLSLPQQDTNFELKNVLST